MNFGHRSSFGCHVAVGDVPPGFCIIEIISGGAHLGSSSPGSVRDGWQSFVRCGGQCGGC
jgi:hypothetical protein